VIGDTLATGVEVLCLNPGEVVVCVRRLSLRTVIRLLEAEPVDVELPAVGGQPDDVGAGSEADGPGLDGSPLLPVSSVGNVDGRDLRAVDGHVE